MNLNPFEIGRIVSKVLKNKDRYQARIEEIRVNPLRGCAGSAAAVYDIDKNRIARIELAGVSEENLELIKKAVNDAFDRADAVWAEFEK